MTACIEVDVDLGFRGFRGGCESPAANCILCGRSEQSVT
jgi:hypothetical protein